MIIKLVDRSVLISIIYSYGRCVCYLPQRRISNFIHQEIVKLLLVNSHLLLLLLVFAESRGTNTTGDKFIVFAIYILGIFDEFKCYIEFNIKVQVN